jgi:stress-induced morphogen
MLLAYSIRSMSNLQFISPVSHRSLSNPLLFLNVRRAFSASPYEKSIMEKLHSATELSNPTRVIVEDRSGGCGANFYILIESEVFRGIPRIKQHRIVQDVLKEDIAKWHAVSIETRLPNK